MVTRTKQKFEGTKKVEEHKDILHGKKKKTSGR